MSNRVEELERQVAELQAAVNGLTEELVEMKERVRQIEDGEVAIDVDAGASASGTDQPAAGPTETEPSPEPSERTTHSDDHVDVVEQTNGAEGDAASGGTEPGADDGTASGDGVEAPKSEDRQEQTDEESEDGDIIVA